MLLIDIYALHLFIILVAAQQGLNVFELTDDEIAKFARQFADHHAYLNDTRKGCDFFDAIYELADRICRIAEPIAAKTMSVPFSPDEQRALAIGILARLAGDAADRSDTEADIIQFHRSLN